MDPTTLLTILGWFTQPAAQTLFAVAQTYVQQRLGLSSSLSPEYQVEPLLDKYLQKLIARLDEDRIAKLYGAFSKLRDAPRSVAKQSLLSSALGDFHEVARIPEQGTTGDRPNAELRCMAFVGMVASYTLLQDRIEIIEEKMIEAVTADAATAEQWLGQDLVREILIRIPAPMISCLQCGFQNPAGSRFCNRDGYPLNSGQKPSSRVVSQTSTLLVRRVPVSAFSLFAFQIWLDYKQVGTIDEGEDYTLDIQAGRHILFVSLGTHSNAIVFTSTPVPFDIASGEKVTFLCQFKEGFWKNSILLLKQ